ncbi:MAG: riboflavin biosynthesis protein RibD [Polynucleobacter sp. 24-46-87]|nr:MAG: riboflavin biosynthesis protein RibD [Polynucleobacter sp. 24-46-87]
MIAKDGKVIGRGYTQRVGGPHAEVQALADVRAKGLDPAGSTIYVTLEPCNHTGRTPPCVDALIEAKPAMVIAAMSDPNPLVGGQGLERLKSAGIEVRCGLLGTEAIALNLGFISRMTRGLPWVRMKIAASLDGKTALPNGQSQWITGPLARTDGHHWRAQACAILTGVGTVKEDDPTLNVRDVQTERQPWRIIVDSKLETPLNAKILGRLDQSGVILVCASLDSADTKEKAAAFEALGVEVIATANAHGKVDLPKLFAYLAKERHMNEIHVEAGFKLNGSLLREGCVDELLLYYAPFFIGDGIGMANISPLGALDQRQDWQIIDQTLFGSDLRLRLSK